MQFSQAAMPAVFPMPMYVAVPQAQAYQPAPMAYQVVTMGANGQAFMMPQPIEKISHTPMPVQAVELPRQAIVVSEPMPDVRAVDIPRQAIVVSEPVPEIGSHTPTGRRVQAQVGTSEGGYSSQGASTTSTKSNTAPAETSVSRSGDDTDESSNERPSSHMTMIELRHGRKRIAMAKQPLSSGTRVLVNTPRGEELATVCLQSSSMTCASGGEKKNKIEVIREISEKEYREFIAECDREENRVLTLARSLAARLQVPLTFNCVTMQWGRLWFILHYTSTQTHPDFRRLLKALRSKLGPNIWLNNCAPDGGFPGEIIEQQYHTP